MAKNRGNNAPYVNPMITNAKYNKFLDARAMKKKIVAEEKKEQLPTKAGKEL